MVFDVNKRWNFLKKYQKSVETFRVTSNSKTTNEVQFRAFHLLREFSIENSIQKQNKTAIKLAFYFLQRSPLHASQTSPQSHSRNWERKTFSLSLLFVAYQNVTFRFFPFCIGVRLLGRASAGIKSTRGYEVDWQSLYFFSHYSAP